jgi:hypothetical protein
MILSPKAGRGTDTHSANHVIHLSRWWNPALEDQVRAPTVLIIQTEHPWSACRASRRHSLTVVPASFHRGAAFDPKRSFPPLFAPACWVRLYVGLFAGPSLHKL